MPSPSPRHANDKDLTALGTAIRLARRTRGVSQEALAHAAQLDRAYLSSLERGLQNPGVINVLRIARALEMSLAELVGQAEL
jgi:transcriptional regulator with XRE-family HTH domain